MSSALFDGYDGTPKAIGRAIIERPFRGNGDSTSLVIRQRYKQKPDLYIPLALKTPHPDYPTAYLIHETDPQPTANGTLVEFERHYAHVPAQQIVPSSQFVTKPALAGPFPQVIGSSLVFQRNESSPVYEFYTQKTVTAEGGAPGSTPGGSYTLTFKGQTTASISASANAATVQSALNALSTISAYGGVTVSGSASSGFTVAFSLATGSANVSSLGVSGGSASAVVSSASSGLAQTVTITPAYGPCGATGSSAFTPASANPIFVGSATNLHDFSFSFGSAGDFLTPASGGTFTLTVYGETTATLNWNDSIATVQAALNALPSVSARGGYTITQISGGYVPVYAARFGAAAITSGTFTLTVLGQTTAPIAYNATNSAIQSAINALSNVAAAGGVTVSGAGMSSTGGSFTFTFANIPAFTANASSLTPSGSSITATTATSQGLSHTITFTVSSSSATRSLTSSSHGITAADSIFVKVNDVYYFVDTGGFSVPDANTITLLSGSGLVSAAGSISQVGKRTSTYTGGSAVLTRTKRVTDFYLPGVTPGIATADDIPLPSYQGDPSSLLSAILAGSTSINYEVGELRQWRDGPILARTITTLNASQL